jgi:hypothetical protein
MAMTTLVAIVAIGPTNEFHMEILTTFIAK